MRLLGQRVLATLERLIFWSWGSTLKGGEAADAPGALGRAGGCQRQPALEMCVPHASSSTILQSGFTGKSP